LCHNIKFLSITVFIVLARLPHKMLTPVAMLSSLEHTPRVLCSHCSVVLQQSCCKYPALIILYPLVFTQNVSILICHNRFYSYAYLVYHRILIMWVQFNISNTVTVLLSLCPLSVDMKHYRKNVLI
jgi:hypothetical protein